MLFPLPLLSSTIATALASCGRFVASSLSPPLHSTDHLPSRIERLHPSACPPIMFELKDIFKRVLTPPAPKIGRIPLPDVGDDDDEPVYTFQQPQAWYSESESSTSSPSSPVAMHFRSSTPQREDDWKPTRRASTPRTDPVVHRGAAPTPLKPVAHRPTLAPARPESRSAHSRSSTSPASSQRASDLRPSPSLAHPKPLKGILKPAPPPQPVRLHSLLCPYNERVADMRKIYFDISQRVEHIRDHDPKYPAPIAVPKAELDRRVSDFPISKMMIRFPDRPQWDFVVHPEPIPEGGKGILVMHVFHEIWKTYKEFLTEEEKAQFLSGPNGERIRKSFEMRCKREGRNREFEMEQGMRRVDTLAGRTIFMGLTRPDELNKPDHHWVLQLGLPKPVTR
ncbi:hypothetical protein BKA93DRAFT_750221 [Sparassis latifolia]